MGPSLIAVALLSLQAGGSIPAVGKAEAGACGTCRDTVALEERGGLVDAVR